MLHPKVARIGWPLKNSQLDALSLLLACQSQMEMYRIAAVGIYSVYYKYTDIYRSQIEIYRIAAVVELTSCRG